MLREARADDLKRSGEKRSGSASLPAQVTDFIHGVSYRSLPTAVQHQAHRCLVDLIAVHLGGLRTECARASRDFACATFGATDRSTASLWFDGRRVSAAGAAYANGMTIDALDMHPGYRAAKGHAGVAVLPAVWATAEGRRDVSGGEFLAAFVIGYELALRCGAALHATASDFHSSGAWSAIGSAAAVSRLLHLSPAQTAHALGIAEYYGPRAPMMRLIEHPTNLKDSSGWGAMTGVSAALLAQAGLTGAPAELLHQRLDEEFSELGTRWEILELYFKPYACCRWAQPAIDAGLALRKEYDFDPTSIERVDVHTFREAVALHVREPDDTDQAQYSLPFSLAAGLVHGRVGASEVTGASLVDPRVLAISNRIVLHEDAYAQSEFPLERYAKVRVALRDGRALESAYHTADGDPETPLTDDAIQAKLNSHARGVVSDAPRERLSKLLWSCHTLEQVAPLLELVATEPW